MFLDTDSERVIDDNSTQPNSMTMEVEGKTRSGGILEGKYMALSQHERLRHEDQNIRAEKVLEETHF